MVKDKCCVLCRTVYIPIRHPKLPPKRATVNSTFSGIRHLFFMAFRLSTSIMPNPRALISSR